MSGFTEAQAVEADGLVDVLEFLRQRAKNGQVVTTDKGLLSYELQKTVGDALFNDSRGTVVGVEIKIEVRFTGNFFIEDWSNLNSHRPTPGWIKTLHSDFIAYYFMSLRRLFIINRQRLFEHLYVDRKDYQYERIVQSKYQQLNKTTGLKVPISTLVDLKICTSQHELRRAA